jgi:UDP:flavonoid glycosyltransferase YjiC (YdhE family)
MRVLFTSTPASGHLRVMVPTAWALRAAGHEVAVGSRPNLVPTATSAGLPTLTAGPELDLLAGLRESLPPGTSVTQMWGTFADVVIGAAHQYAEKAAEVSGELTAQARAWRPDLIVHEPLDFAGPLAAAALGIPAVRHRWAADSFAGTFDDEARRVLSGSGPAGPDPLPPPAMIIDPGPPAVHRPDAPPGTPMRFVPFNGAGPAPDWTLHPAARARVCVSLGTECLALGGTPALHAALRALAGLDAEIIVAINGRDRHLVGPVPLGTRVVEMVPLHLFLGGCGLLVHHGGAGSALTACALGVPQLVLPQIVDQFDIGARLEASGAGHMAAAPEAQRDPSRLRELMADLLGGTGPRKAARHLAEVNESLPTPADLVPALAALTG